MYHTVGAFCIGMSCFYLAAMKAKERRRKYQNLVRMEQAFFFLRQEVAFHLRELQEACRCVSAKTSGEISRFFGEIADKMQEDSTCTFSAAWRSVQAQERRPMLPKAAEEYLAGHSAALGDTSFEMEQMRLLRITEMLAKLKAEEAEQLREQEKTGYTVGALGGAFLFLLLL